MSSPDPIRPATLADAPALSGIRQAAILELASPSLGTAEASRWAYARGQDRVERAIEQHEVWLMEHDGAARGWVEIHGDRIEGLYVAPASARAGIGTALMAQAEGRILAAGHTSAMLDASENAEPFYLARGYEPRGEILDDGSIPMRKAVEA